MRRLRPSPEMLLTCAFAVLGMIWGAYLGSRQIAGIDLGLERIEYLTLDWRFLLAGVRQPPRGVVIAAIDDDALRAIGAYPVPRDTMARLVRALASRQPQAIALDILFLDPGAADADAMLAEALRTARSVVGAIGIFKTEPYAGTPLDMDGSAFIPSPWEIVQPVPAVRGAARSGLVNLSTDNDGVPRFVPMLFRAGNDIAPSFALATTAAALNTEPVFTSQTVRLAARSVPLDFGLHLPIRYYGPRGTMHQFSVARVLDGSLDPDLVRGQVVVLGITALATGDAFAVPFDRTVPGVEILATAISNLLAGDGLIRNSLTRRLDAVAAVILPALVILFLGIRRVAIGAAAAGILLIAWMVAVCGAFVQGYWMSMAVPLAAVVPAAGAYGLARLVLDRTRAQRLTLEKTALAKFQSPSLVQHILADPEFLEKPVSQEVAVVFLDLSGFTGIAELLGPQWARDMLADFHTRIDREVTALGGYVAGFMGDGAMIIFGLPSAKSDDASRALQAVARLRESVTQWIAALPRTARERLGVRIGGHFGPAVLSRLGGAQHQHVTATGDTVNVTSRLLEVAKNHGSGFVVSEKLWGAAAASTRGSMSAGLPLDVEIRGRAKPLRVRLLK